jgi:hypothetical protein
VTRIRFGRLLLALVVGLALAGCASGRKTAAPATTPATTTADPSRGGWGEDTGFPDEGITDSTPPESTELKVGETAELSSVDTNEPVARVLISKVEAIRGEEYNKPERGWFLGVYVKVRALADEQTSLWGDFYVLMRGHHYDPDAYAERWKPELDYVDLNERETAEGWLVFDTPARHGEVVLGQPDGDGKIATWGF